MSNIPKKLVKKAARVTLVQTKKVLKHNKLTRRAGIKLKKIILADSVVLPPGHYNVNKYYPSIPDYRHQLDTWEGFKNKPTISILIPTYNTDITFLRECVESVIAQSYPLWELCIADDASPDKNVAKTIQEYAKKDGRIKYIIREKNGHISEATNSALGLASGEFVALLDHDDILWPNALYEVIRVINEHPDADLIYTDEDKVDAKTENYSYPFFKPDWSPEFLESCNYITHFSTIRRSMMDRIGGFRKGFEGAQDWDLFLRITDLTDKVQHIPKILYSWRVHEASTAHDTDAKPYVYEAQKKSLEDHVARMAIGGVVNQGIIKQHSSVLYDVDPETSVLLVVETTNTQKLMRILRSAGHRSDVVVVGGAPRGDLESTMYEIEQSQLIKSIDYKQIPKEVSLAELMNDIATESSQEFIAYVNGSLDFKTDNWLTRLLANIQREGVGAVGIRTLKKDGKHVHQAGVALGIEGLFGNVLEGADPRDNNYLRGLYGLSRRNVAAIDKSCYIVRRTQLSKNPFNTDLTNIYVVDFCLSRLAAGERIVYDPNITAVDYGSRPVYKGPELSEQEKAYISTTWSDQLQKDPYYNTNLTRKNPFIEIS